MVAVAIGFFLAGEGFFAFVTIAVMLWVVHRSIHHSQYTGVIYPARDDGTDDPRG